LTYFWLVVAVAVAVRPAQVTLVAVVVVAEF
jgi:hypothetical protein